MAQSAGIARAWLEGAGLFAAALALCFLGYLAGTVPGRWFGGEASRIWSATQFSLTRGSGAIDGGELIVTGTDGSGTAVASLDTDFRSSDYRAIAFDALHVPEQATLRVLWRSDYAPGKLNSAPIIIASGRLLPVVLARDPNWIGRIRGIALLVQGPLPGSFRVRGVAAKPMSALEVAGDRVREWLGFEAFTGTSIDGITGGDGVWELSLPALLALSALLAGVAAFAVARAGCRIALLPPMLAAIFLAAWLVQDARWFVNLGRHAPYFRDRAAYHLYPHNVLFDPYANTMPDSTRMRSGDYVVVYQRRGVQFDPSAGRLRWDDGTPVAAELMLSEAGSALFRLR